MPLKRKTDQIHSEERNEAGSVAAPGFYNAIYDLTKNGGVHFPQNKILL